MKRLYKIRFAHQSSIYEVYAKSVGSSDIFGFIEIQDFVFGQSASLVVDPAEEKLKAEFDGVKSCYVPMHAILRIDEVIEKTGVAKITEIKGKQNNVTNFPNVLYTPADQN